MQEKRRGKERIVDMFVANEFKTYQRVILLKHLYALMLFYSVYFAPKKHVQYLIKHTLQCHIEEIENKQLLESFSLRGLLKRYLQLLVLQLAGHLMDLSYSSLLPVERIIQPHVQRLC